MNRIPQRHFIFHPVTVLGVSILAAAIFAVFVNLSFDGDFRWFLLYYFTPIGIPFVAFLFDRIGDAPEGRHSVRAHPELDVVR